MKTKASIAAQIAANLDHVMAQAVDPAVLVKQLIADMEESLIELRCDTLRALAREKQLRKQIQASQDLVQELAEQAKQAVHAGNEALAKQVLARKLHTQKARETLEKDLQEAREIVAQRKADLPRLEDQVQLARRKKEDLVRRRAFALRGHAAPSRTGEVLNTAINSISDLPSTGKALGIYQTMVSQVEQAGEQMSEAPRTDFERELDFQKLDEDNSIEDELERLKREQTQT